MVNWQKEAVSDLRNYPLLVQSLAAIREQQAALDLQAGLVRSSFRDSEPVSGGGGSGAEDKLLSLIVKRERLGGNYQAVSVLVQQIEGALEQLDSKQRLVLERFFIHRCPNHVERLCAELGYEQAQVYRIKNEALRDFTRAMYGVTEL